MARKKICEKLTERVANYKDDLAGMVRRENEYLAGMVQGEND